MVRESLQNGYVRASLLKAILLLFKDESVGWLVGSTWWHSMVHLKSKHDLVVLLAETTLFRSQLSIILNGVATKHPNSWL